MTRAVPLLVLALTSAIAWCSSPAADNDLWGHIVFGREILARGGLPAANRYSYTAPDFPWVNHEIVAECIFAAVYDRLGAAGLLAGKALLGAVTLAIVGHTVRRRTGDVLAASLVVLLVAPLVSSGFLCRPQIFSFLALAILCERLHAESRGEAGRSLWLFPPLFALWINTHGGVLAGLGIAATHAISPDASRASRQRRLAVTLASAASLLLNPYGTDLLTFLVHDVTLDRPLPEWWPIPIVSWSNAGFKASLLLLAIGFLRRTPGASWEALALPLAAIATFRHERHLPLFAILAAPRLGDAILVLQGLVLARLPGRPAALSVGARRLLLAGLLGVGVVQAESGSRIHRELGLEMYVWPGEYPVETFAFLRANGLGGKVALPFDWGEYAIWHLPEGSRVNIDGRYTTAYPESVIDEAWRYMDGGRGWETHLVGADLAIADRRHATAARLGSLPAWTRIHEDGTAIVFARAEAARGRSFRPPPPPAGRVDLFP